MYRKLLIFLGFLIIFLFNTSGVLAETLTFDRAYQDYLFTRTTYENSYRDFEASKNAYLGNPTLSLRDETKAKLLIMLRNRDQMMSTYLTALRTRISELSALNTDLRNGILGKIDQEVLWYQNHKSNYKDDDQVESLFTKNDEAKSHYNGTSIFVINESLFDISLGEEQGMRVAQEQIFTELKEIINQRVAAGTLTLTPFNNWFNDIERTTQTLKERDAKSSEELQKMYTQSNAGAKAFGQALDILSTTVQPLAQLNQYLTEILAYIRNNQ